MMKNEKVLRKLHCASKAQKPFLAGKLTPSQIHAICECSFNVVRGNLELSPELLAILRLPEVREWVYQLADPNISIRKKREIIKKQVGGIGFAVLLPLVIQGLFEGGKALYNYIKKTK
jgi:hypothetical protein